MGLLESLVGIKQVRLSSCIGVYISLDAIYAAEVRTETKTVRIERFVKIPIAHLRGPDTDIGRASAMHSEFFINENLWLLPMQEAFKKVKWDTKNVQVTLSPEFAVFRHFLMPYVERRFWRQSIPLEAKKYVPFPFDESVFDFHAYPFNPQETRSKLGVLFGITNKKISGAIKTGIAKIGYELMGIEVASSSVTRAFSVLGATGGDGKAFAHFDASVAHLLLTHKDVPLLFREVSFEDAQSTERRRLDVRGSVDFINKQLGTTIFSEILLSGVNLELWQGIIEEDSKLSVKQWDPKKVVNLQELDWGTLAAIGCTLCYMPDQSGLLDLIEKERVSIDDQKTQLFAYFLASSLAALVLLLAGLSYMKTVKMNLTISNLKKNTPEISEFAERDAAQIADVVTQFNEKESKIRAIMSETTFFTPQLVAITDAIPKSTWITALSYVRQIGVNTEVSISGGVQTNDPQNDVNLANTIKEALKKDEAMKVYTESGNKFSMQFDTAKEKGEPSRFEIKCTEVK
ncbi:MAG: hypothetical protein PHW69_04220 [Elusimicrobiaceae bacterium]|nr:hypothetical protein [Elusimicrobiaceae bacterium]